jgi:hypothetical protein
MKIITHLHLLLRSRTHGTPPYHHGKVLTSAYEQITFLHNPCTHNPVTKQKLTIGVCTTLSLNNANFEFHFLVSFFVR